MKDLKINLVGGLPELALEAEDTIRNNIYLSLAIRKGTWWHDPGFGLDWSPRQKLTSRTPALLRERCLEALKWILDIGRAKSIEVTTERDTKNRRRINVLVEAVQADGREVTFETYTEVI
jgi:phage gp46-like protein